MTNHFRIKDFLIDPYMRQNYACVPLHVVEKIIKYHLPILNELSATLDFEIRISANSGYRSREWEIIHGRDGYSEHTFSGFGAVDLTCDSEHAEKLKQELIRSDYSRVAWYKHKNFFHCDFKDGKLGKKYYEVNKQGIWREIKDARYAAVH